MTATTEGRRQRARERLSASPVEREIAESLQTQNPATIRAGIIHAWANQHNILSARLSRAGSVRHILDAGEPHAASLFQRTARRRKITLKHVERVFETVVEPSPKRKQGAVYTPDFVIDYLINHGLRFLTGSHRSVPNFCDPACGSGGFLLRGAKIFARRFRLTMNEVFERHIRGLDNDPRAVEQARCLLSLFLIQHDSRHELAQLSVQRADSLLLSTAELRERSSFEHGIDLLATNPPYVKLQNLPRAYRERLAGLYPEYAKGSFSLALLFLIAGHRALSARGILAFITQNNLFTSLAGKSVRQYLQTNQSLRRIVDFQHHRVFQDASAYTCLLFLGAEPRHEFQFDQLRGPIRPAALKSTRFARIRHDTLEARKWRLAKPPHLENLQRMEALGIALGKLAKISVGFATLKDSVFLLRGSIDPSRELFCTEHGQLIELGITRGAVKVAEMRGEQDLTRNERRVIFPYRRQDGRWSVIDEEELSADYPLAYQYLKQMRQRLEARDKGRRQYETWYCWARTQGREAVGPKLLTKTFSRSPNFMLDPSDQLFCNGYGIALRPEWWPDNPLATRCLQRVLNSNVMDYYAKLTSFQIEGNYQCYQKNFIERFSIPLLSMNELQLLVHCDEREFCEILPAYYGLRQSDIDEVVS